MQAMTQGSRNKEKQVPLAKDFGNRLKELRSLKNLTQAQLAERSGLSLQYLGRVERGLSTPSFNAMERLCRALDTEPANLFLFTPRDEPTSGQEPRSEAAPLQAASFVTLAGIWRRDPETGADHWSNSLHQLLGHAARETSPSVELFLEHVQKDDRKRVEEALGHMLSNVRVSDLEFGIHRQDGGERIVLVHADRISLEKGDDASLYLTVLDITDWRQLRQELLHNRRLLEEHVAARTRALHDAVQNLQLEHGKRAEAERGLEVAHRITQAAGDALAFVNADYVYLLVNKRYEELSGLPRQEIEGRRVPEFMGEEVFARLIKPHLDKALAGESVRYQGEFLSPTLGPRYKDVSYTPSVEQGEITGVVVTSRDFTEYQCARQELQKREERFRLMVENMPVLIHAHDEEGRYIYWNKESERVTGYSAEEVMNSPDSFRLLYPDDSYREKIFRPIHDLQRSFRNITLTFTAKDGLPRTIAWSNISHICPVPGWAYWEVGIDVTEQRRAEEALRASTELFSKAFDNDHVAVAVIRRETSAYLDVNPGFVRMSGYSRQEIVGRTSLELGFVTEEQRLAMLAEIDSQGMLRSREHTFQAKTGQFRTVLFSLSPMTLHCQECFIVTMVDITGRMLAEEALKRSEAYLRTVLESTEDMICTRDSHDRLVRCNQAFAELLPQLLRVEAEPGLRTLDFLPNENRRHWEQVMERVRAGERHRELLSVEVDGRTRWYDLSLRPIVLDGAIVGTAEFTRDVTLLKEVEESQARKADLLQKAEVLADLGAWEWDMATGMGRFSRNWRRMHGVDSEEMVMDELWRLAHPEDTPRIEEAFAQARRGAPYSIRHRIVHGKTGDVRHVQAYGEVEFCPRTGAALRMVGATQDITRRVSEEQRLLAAYNALDSSANGIAFSDLDGAITYANPSFLRLFPHSPSEEVLGGALWELLDIADAAPILHELRESGRHTRKLRLDASDGVERGLILEAQLVRGPTGEPLCLMWVILEPGRSGFLSCMDESSSMP
jgi:PAS domain S-box-containing protein